MNVMFKKECRTETMKLPRNGCHAIELSQCFGRHLLGATPELLNYCLLTCSSVGSSDPNHELPMNQKPSGSKFAVMAPNL